MSASRSGNGQRVPPTRGMAHGDPGPAAGRHAAPAGAPQTAQAPEAAPLTFALVGRKSEPQLVWFSTGLGRVFERHGHRHVATGGDLRLAFNFVDPLQLLPFRRKGKATFAVSVVLTDDRPTDVLKAAYPLLIRSLANLCIYMIRQPDHVETYFVTLEQGYYRAPDVDWSASETGRPAGSTSADDAFFEYIYERLLPLATSELVIDNEFHPDLPQDLWNGDALTEQLAAAGRRLDALDLLPAAFPMQELLPPADFRHVQRLFGIGGLSYGNLSVRKDATRYWMSASGVDKGNMRVIGQDMLLVKGFDPARRVMLLSVPPHVKPRRVSVDAIEHWMIYTEHPTVGAIVHVHAWMAGVRSTTVNYPCGTIQLATAVADIVREAPEPTRAVVGLRNHGLTITGPNLAEIFDRLERNFIRQVPMS